jgi:hypothetical protein
MKKSYIFSLFLFVAVHRLTAQNITATETNFEMTVKSTDTDVHVETYVKNNSADTVTLSWTRTIVCASDPAWKSYICDPNICYGENTSSSLLEISIAPNQESLFSFHINPHGVTGNGEFRLKIYEIINPANNVELIFKANGAACSSSTNEPSVAAVEAAPNPTTDYFRLLNAENITAVNIFTLDGRRIAHLEATSDHVYPVGNLQTANYMLGLEDRTGRIVRTILLKKL